MSPNRSHQISYEITLYKTYQKIMVAISTSMIITKTRMLCTVFVKISPCIYPLHVDTTKGQHRKGQIELLFCRIEPGQKDQLRTVWVLQLHGLPISSFQWYCQHDSQICDAGEKLAYFHSGCWDRPPPTTINCGIEMDFWTVKFMELDFPTLRFRWFSLQYDALLSIIRQFRYYRVEISSTSFLSVFIANMNLQISRLFWLVSDFQMTGLGKI